ncbi:hypothetical protein [Flagellimonas nanhaiensis]|uniref:hypothetical protein n=1 Tax=Flagellimonas nanhaiensis TaxID=2292706 RepID=UPI0015F29BED|nr:hypothetical protein [Allomuricauda nanhaiensis]
MERVLTAISTTSFVSALVLFIYWMLDNSSVDVSGSPSGWWWFGFLLLGVFTHELNDY